MSEAADAFETFFRSKASAASDIAVRIQPLRDHRASLFSLHDSPDKAVLDDDIRATPQNPKRNHRTEATVVTVDASAGNRCVVPEFGPFELKRRK